MSTTIFPERVDIRRGYVGEAVPRKEDGRLVQGQGIYADDVRRHEAGYVHLVRSPHAHARILRIDFSRALALDGVYGTLTGEEVAELTDPYFQLTLPPASELKDYCMAVGKVRYMGEPVAAVVGATRDVARDAADLVEVEYEPLDVNVDGRRALHLGAPMVHDETGTNLIWEGTFDYGDVEVAFAEADRIVEIDELHFHRFSSTPIECCAAVVEYDRGRGEWTLYCNHQFPGFALVFMAPALRTGMDKIRFITQDIGGGFGNKVIWHTYLLICCLLARRLNRPVHWTEWRTEHHMANAGGNERWFHQTQVAVRADGTILGFRTRATDDCGAYPRYEPIGCVIWLQVMTGCYRIRNVCVDFKQVCTNKAPVGPNRGYSRLQHLWFLERMIDIVGYELGIDPLGIRKRNYVRADEMPYETANGCIYDSGDYARCLDSALDLIDYGRWRERQGAADGHLIGIGIGSTLDSGTNNFVQSQFLNPELEFSGNSEVATAKLDIFGEIVITIGTAPQGQGHETTAAQVAADILGVAPDAINVRRGFDSWFNNHAGFSGTYASQFAVTGLGAVKGAAEQLAGEIKRLAAVVLGVDDPDSIVLEDGFAKVRDDPEAALTFMACGAIVNANNAVLPSELDDVMLNCRYVYRPPFTPVDVARRYGNLTLTYATQVHACVVKVDPELGEVEILDYAVVDDCGTRVNPQIVEGQVHGATAHAIGAALHEAFVYDEDGLLLTCNFYDYHAIHALDMPSLKDGFIESPSPFTPLGAKGLGEGGGGGLHAVSAAIQNALSRAGGGIVHDSFNPPERVWRLLNYPNESRRLVRVAPL